MDYVVPSETILALCLGIGLSAACGFRVFVPLLGINLAAASGHLTLADGFEWLASPAATVVFSTATVLEIGAYYVPWVDHLLDSLATPAAAVAGVIVTAAVITEMSPLLKWSLAVIAGGGTAGTVQTSTVMLRGVSTYTTAGMGNFVVSTGEWFFSLVMTAVAIVAPFVAAGIVLIAGFAVVRWLTAPSVRFAPAEKKFTPAK